jgi:hypothetical protein
MDADFAFIVIDMQQNLRGFTNSCNGLEGVAAAQDSKV